MAPCQRSNASLSALKTTQQPTANMAYRQAHWLNSPLSYLYFTGYYCLLLTNMNLPLVTNRKEDRELT